MKNLRQAFILVFARPRYIAGAIGVATVIYASASFLPTKDFLKYIFTSMDFDFGARLFLVTQSLLYLPRNSSVIAFVLLMIVLALAAVNAMFSAFILARKAALEHAAGAGMAGIIAGLIGIGCSACGSVILSSLIGVAATGQIIGVLPLKGIEFFLISVTLLMVSTLYLGAKIANPAVCQLPSQKK